MRATGAAEAELEKRPSGGRSSCHSLEQRGEGFRRPSCGARLGNKVTDQVEGGGGVRCSAPARVASLCVFSGAPVPGVWVPFLC